MSLHQTYIGKYALVERLGQGGMAEVWKACDPHLMRFVALKLLYPGLSATPDFIQRFIREGQVIASLRHPNIVQIHDLQVISQGIKGTRAYMVMDYIEGETLAQYLWRTSHEHKFPSPYEIVRLIASISCALDYAHEHGFIHRDVKPANILLDAQNTWNNPSGEPILTDFGIVKMVGSHSLTHDGTLLGTPLYMAPELVKGLPGSKFSDIYSLGVVLYEMVTGMPPFRGDTAFAIMRQHLQETPIPPSHINPNLPTALDAVLARCLAKNAEERFSSAFSLTVALAQAMDVPAPEQRRVNSLPLTANRQSQPFSLSSFEQEAQPGGSHPNITGVPTHLTSPYTAGEPMRATALLAKNGVDLYATQNALPPTHTQIAEQQVPQPDMHTPLPVGGSLSSSAHPSTPLRTATRKRIISLILVASVVTLISVSLAGVWYWQQRSKAAPVEMGHGQANFFDSGQADANGDPSRNDSLEVHLAHVPAPTPGTQYYAWLRNDQVEAHSIYLGVLPINQGIVDFTYTDPQHRNLLNLASAFLVTEEPVNVVPNTPSLDRNLWRYTGVLSQQHSPKDNHSELDHLRHLLSAEPELEKLHLHGGVDMWLQHSMEKMQIAAIAVRDHRNLSEVRQQLTNTLYYLDGPCAPQDLQNTQLPPNPEAPDVALSAHVGLLDCAKQPEPPGHITHLGEHLDGIVQVPGTTADQRKRAADINANLNPIKAELDQVRKIALQLAPMNDVQLQQAQGLRVDIATHADRALNGQIDPDTQHTIPSIKQLCDDVELLASMQVNPYKG